MQNRHSMESSDCPTFNIIDNLTPSQTQNDAVPSGDNDLLIKKDKKKRLFVRKKKVSAGKKKGRGLAKNYALKRKLERGESFDIHIPAPFHAICGNDAKLLKTEICCKVRHFVPLEVKDWTKVDDDVQQQMWTHLQTTFGLPDSYNDDVMRQVRSQFDNRRFRLGQDYKREEGCSEDVSEDAWNWLIDNRWEDDDFKKRSEVNHENRLKITMPSVSGSKKYIQTAFELSKKSETNEWPSATELWKVTRKRKNGDWAVSDGKDTMEAFEVVGDVYKEEISSAPIPLVEHFEMILGKSKSGYVRGLGVKGMTKSFKERTSVRIEAEAARKKANLMEQKVEQLNDQLKNQEMKHQAEIEALKKQFNDFISKNGSEQPAQDSQMSIDDDILNSKIKAAVEQANEKSKKETRDQMLKAYLSLGLIDPKDIPMPK